MRYYISEHEQVYREIAERGYDQWNDLFDGPDRWTYEHFQNRHFLEHVLERFTFPPEARAFEYGCGTGPAACFLAQCGFQVDAVDLIPNAIEMARKRAEERDLTVNFYVADIVALESDDDRYDLVLDSYCLQSVVLDNDREAVFAAVRERLKPDGHYVISTALQHASREIDHDDYFDVETDILYRAIPEGLESGDAIEVNGRSMIPHRRHRTTEGIADELTSAGFVVVENGSHAYGDIVCRLATNAR